MPNLNQAKYCLDSWVHHRLHLDAVKESVGAFASLVVLNAPCGDLTIRSDQRLGLHAHDLFLHFLAAAEQIEAGLDQQPGHGIKVGAERLAADTGGLEGNGTAAAETIADTRRMAEGTLAELFDQLGQASRRSA